MESFSTTEYILCHKNRLFVKSTESTVNSYVYFYDFLVKTNFKYSTVKCVRGKIKHAQRYVHKLE